MTFMRKLLDILNMDNWKKENDTSDDEIELVSDSSSSNQNVEVTEEEIIESFKKQYYIVDESKSEEPAADQRLAPAGDDPKEEYKPDGAGEMKKTADGFLPDRQTEILYHDRYGEEPCYEDNYREITFNGRNFNIPEVQLCAAILLNASVNGSKIRENNHYSLYFEGRYGIMNISTLHRWIYEQGYLRSAVLREALNLYKVPELKIILESLGLKKSGNKEVLIDRVIGGINDDEKAKIVNDCEHLFLTDKGREFLRENEDYVMYHRKSYGVTFEEFNKHRILQGRKRQFHDTIFQALNEKAFTYQYKQWFSRLEMIYFWLGECLYDEGRYDLAIRYYIYRLYFSTNLASNTGLFTIELVQFEGIEKEKEYIKLLHDTFNKNTLNRLIELKKFYGDNLLNIVYGMQILPYCIFDRTDMADAIHDLYEGTFDENFYTNYICTKYENYIKNFL